MVSTRKKKRGNDRACISLLSIPKSFAGITNQYRLSMQNLPESRRKITERLNIQSGGNGHAG